MITGPNWLQSWWWARRIARMKQCRTCTQLVKRFGEPDQKVLQRNVEIWQYRLKLIDGMAYTIHVAVINGNPSQAYLHMTPAEPMQ